MPADPKTRELFTVGLRNAHAMENQALGILRPQLSRIENYPQVAGRLEQHIRETENQLERLDELLAGLGESSSTLKDTALSVMGTMAALGHSVAGDEILKNSFANFAFENFEIAAYTSLSALAQVSGDHRAESAILENLREEEAMAEWLRANIPALTRQFANLREMGRSAKV